jgi:hypothetical protein
MMKTDMGIGVYKNESGAAGTLDVRKIGEPMSPHRNFDVTISEPCSQNWELIQTRNAARFCEQCNRSVVDTASMTAKQVELLAMRSAAGESICARVTKTSDGALLVRDEDRATRFSGAARAAISMVLAAGLPAAAQTAASSEKLPPCVPITRPDQIVSGCEKPQPPATVTGRLLRPDGSAVHSGLVYLNGEGKTALYVLDQLGMFELHEQPGTYDIIVQTGPEQAEHIGAVQLHNGFQSFGDVRTRDHQEALIESDSTGILVGEVSSTVRWSWKSRIRHPLLYMRSVLHG